MKPHPAMSTQPVFTNPAEAIGYIRSCLEQNDPDRLYAAFSEETSSFWRDHLFASLGEIDRAETLESVFLEDGQINEFPQQDSVLHLGGHGPRTHYLHLKLGRATTGWVLVSIHICR